jgi:hypothetical protein
MQTQQESTKKDWRIGITWEVLVTGIYALGSLFEIVSDPASTNVVAILLLAGISYFTISAYRIQRENLLGLAAKSATILGFVLLAVLVFFSVANLLLMSSGELTQDMSYLNILLIIALFKLSFSLRKRYVGSDAVGKK